MTILFAFWGALGAMIGFIACELMHILAAQRMERRRRIITELEHPIDFRFVDEEMRQRLRDAYEKGLTRQS